MAQTCYWKPNGGSTRSSFNNLEQRRETDPIFAAEQAIVLAQAALASKGFGLPIAEGWLRHGLAVLAREGATQYQLSVDRLLFLTQDASVRSWLVEIVKSCRPPPDPDRRPDRHLCQTLLDPRASVQ